MPLGAVLLECGIHLNKKRDTMIDFFSTEIIVAGSLIFVSGVVIVVSLVMVLPQQEKKSKVDVAAAVRDAPYHLLADIGIEVAPPSECNKIQDGHAVKQPGDL